MNMEKQTVIISKIRKSYNHVKEQLEGLEVGQSATIDGKVFTKVSQDICEVEYSSDYKDYKFSNENKVGSYKIENEISAEEVETVIVNSLEGGSAYWLGVDNTTTVWEKKPKDVPIATWVTQMLLEGKTIYLYDIEEGEDEDWSLTLDDLIRGFKLNAKERPFDSDVFNGDVETADCIMQYALFGELVYG